jgi:uncharacterized membrane protein YgdD (TMEM256/DUF423 family)
MKSFHKTPAFWGALFLGLAVMLGAFGAHGLEKSLSEKAIATYKTGVTYQFYHGFALLILALLPVRSFQVKRITLLFILGIFLFSFNCYIYALTQIKTFALIVPVGGVSFIGAWIYLTRSLWRLDVR